MSKRLQILSLVHNLYFGGDETRLLAFAKSYDRSRFEHTVASIHLPDPDYNRRNGTMRDQFAAAGVEVIDLGERHHQTNSASIRPDQLMRTLAKLVRSIRKVRRVIQERNVDIIDARLHSPILVGALTGRISGIPSVATTYSFEGKPTILRKLTTQLSLGMTNAVITDSRLWQKKIQAAILRPNARVLVIPNGIFVPAPMMTPSQVKSKLGIPDDPDLRLVSQISRLVPYKGHAVLLNAAKTVLDAYPNVFFLLIGHDAGGDYQRQLEQQARDLGIASRVRITGYDGPIGDIWQIVDVHAHASLLDSLPNAIIEGMAVGKPAVVTSVGGIPDLVEHEETGLVVPPNDPDVLATNMLRLLRDGKLAKKLGSAARQRYQMSYTPEVMSRRLEDLFVELCTKRGS